METPGAGRAIVAIFVLQALLLTVGIARDYQLKHEDNNALHATFARSHLHLGLATTRGQNYFYSPDTGTGLFYPHHPPGPGLVLAAVYGITGSDGPAATRATAIAFHILGTWLFYGLARRVLRQPREVVTALLLYVVLPESAFFGRMLNHEVLVLPAAILLVRGYWESVHGDWPRRRWIAAVAGGAFAAALSGWAGFLAIGACGLHAVWEAFVRRNGRASQPLALIAAAGAALFAAVIGQLLWILGGDLGYLRDLLVSRSGDGDPGLHHWIGRILELHWRYFGLASVAALAAIAVRAARRRGTAPIDPAQDTALIFLLAGGGYVVAFAFNATLHDYWQFLLLPASALGIVLLMRGLATAVRSRPLRYAVVGLIVFDVTLVAAVTLVQRHTKTEGYCLRVVAELRRHHL
jgi:hypothetical protein